MPSNVPELAAVIWDLLENCIFQQQEQEVLAPELSLEGLSKADYFPAIAFWKQLQLVPAISLGSGVRTLGCSPDSTLLCCLNFSRAQTALL